MQNLRIHLLFELQSLYQWVKKWDEKKKTMFYEIYKYVNAHKRTRV